MSWCLRSFELLGRVRSTLLIERKQVLDKVVRAGGLFILCCALSGCGAMVDVENLTEIGRRNNSDPSSTYDKKSMLLMSPRGGFTVFFPQDPRERSGEHSGLQYSTQFFYSNDDIHYEVASGLYYSMTGNRLTDKSIAPALDSIAANCVRVIKGTKKSESSVTLSGGLYPGRQIDGTINGTNEIFSMRVYVDPPNKRHFVLIVYGNKQHVESAPAKRFLDSLIVLPVASQK